MLAPTYAPVALVTRAFRVVPAQDWVDIVVPVSGRPGVSRGRDDVIAHADAVLGQPGAAQPAVSLPLGATSALSLPASPGRTCATRCSPRAGVRL